MCFPVEIFIKNWTRMQYKNVNAHLLTLILTYTHPHIHAWPQQASTRPPLRRDQQWSHTHTQIQRHTRRSIIIMILASQVFLLCHKQLTERWTRMCVCVVRMWTIAVLPVPVWVCVCVLVVLVAFHSIVVVVFFLLVRCFTLLFVFGSLVLFCQF